jgi:hypothetical protein
MNSKIRTSTHIGPKHAHRKKANNLSLDLYSAFIVICAHSKSRVSERRLHPLTHQFFAHNV